MYNKLSYEHEIMLLNRTLAKVADQKTNAEFILNKRTRENNLLLRKLSSLANTTDLQLDTTKRENTGNAPLVIIVPFIKSQIPRIKESLRRWAQDKYAPRDIEQPGYDNCITDMVFYFNKGPDEDMSAQIRAIIDEFDLKQFFHDMYFYYANLSDADDVYPLATSHMFYKLIDDPNIRQKYKYMFYMEPDVLVIRKGWMQNLHNMAFGRQKPFFVMGSINRGTFINIPEHRVHINGNAIYSLSESYRQYLNEVRSNVYFVFDLDQYMYLQQYFTRLQEFWHMFVFDDFIINLYKTHWSEKQLVEENPNTVSCFIFI